MTQNNLQKTAVANFIQAGEGAPVVMIHGVSASLHDWDDLVPDLTQNGYASYALDLLGHGDSPKPASRAYTIEQVFDHFLEWMTSLRLTESAILIGHSLGGYLALEYARRFSIWTRGLVLVNPFYSRSQLPFFLRRSYSSRNLRGLVVGRTPEWVFRLIVNMTSVAMGHSAGNMHSLPERIREQTAVDYARTAPGIYNVPSTMGDLTEHLASITFPTLVVWGDRDGTLAPNSFQRLVNLMPRAEGVSVRAGHVPHQSNAGEFNKLALEFLSKLST